MVKYRSIVFSKASTYLNFTITVFWYFSSECYDTPSTLKMSNFLYSKIISFVKSMTYIRTGRIY